MMGFIMKLISFLLLFSLFPIHSISQVTHTVNFSYNDLSVSDITGEDSIVYSKVEYTDLQFNDELGAPNLPVKIIHLIIPSYQNVRSININPSGQQFINLSHLVYPTQLPYPTLTGFEGNDFVEPDPVIYNSANPYPLELAKSSSEGYFDGRTHCINSLKMSVNKTL